MQVFVNKHSGWNDSGWYLITPMLIFRISACLSAIGERDPRSFRSALPTGREAGYHSHQNTGSHAAPSRGRYKISWPF